MVAAAIKGLILLVLFPGISYGAEPRFDVIWRSYLRGGTGPRNTLTEVSGRRAGALLPVIVVVMVVGGALANGAAAQGTVVIGGDGKSGVEIDLDA